MTHPKPPVAEPRPCETRHHGITLNDPYAWLRADNWRDVMRDPRALADDIRSWLIQENDHADAMLADVEDLKDQLFEELKGRIKQDDSSVPLPDGAYAYATRFVAGAEQPMLVRTRRDGSDETVLLDGNREAEVSDYFRLGGAAHSPNHALLAWGADTRGSEYFELKFRDLATGEDLPTSVPDTAGSATWANDNQTVFYTRLDENHRPSKVFRHIVGTPPDKDVLVYEEQDSGFFASVGKTRSGRFIVIDCHDHQTSECWLIDADAPLEAPVCVAARDVGVEYSVEHHGERLLILANADGAEDFKIVEAPSDSPERSNWRDVIAHEEGRLILSHGVFKDFMVWLERREGLPRIVVRDHDTGAERSIAFDEEAYSLGLSGGHEFETSTIRFTYSSMTTPSRVYDYDVTTGDRVLRKEQEVPSGHDPDLYVTRRILAPAHDGEQIPVSLFHRKDTAIDGSAPCLLYGYGAYGISIPASFDTDALSLVDRGFVHAIAHVRGGKDKGYRWYRLGRTEHKENTFLDFIAAARHLVAEQYTTPGRLIAQGRSAGGMLMGAVANMAPKSFAGIIAEVPFVDVLNTMLDATLPLTPPEWLEWGNPIEDEEAFKRMAAYSPYDNVTARAYPAILAVAGLTDPRVTYWEPAKWVAKLRANKTDDNLLLLRTNMGAGHGGASGRFARLEEVAVNHVFALKVANAIGG